jgi:hypothetical protein
MANVVPWSRLRDSFVTVGIVFAQACGPLASGDDALSQHVAAMPCPACADANGNRQCAGAQSPAWAGKRTPSISTFEVEFKEAETADAPTVASS